MATAPSLLHSSGSSFFAQFRAFPLSSSTSVFPHVKRHGNAAVPVRASDSGVVLLEKSDAEKTNRLKTAYTEKIVPLLIEEFSYTNKHQVLQSFCYPWLMGVLLRLFDSKIVNFYWFG